jgi:hypothetical protein
VHNDVLAYDQPPWDISTPAVPQTIATVALGIVVAGFVIAALVDWRRIGRPNFLLMILGGYICSFNEPLIDFLCHCYFPADGWIGHTVFDRAIPVWVILAYVIFYGALTYVVSVAFSKGITRRTLWTSIAIWAALNLVMEIPLLKSGLYLYYGDQPFMIGGFPISQVVFNALGSLLGAVVITRLDWFFTGPRQLLLLFVPFVTFMSSWTLGMPFFLVLGTDAPTPVRYAAAALAMAIGLYAIDVLIRIGTGQLRIARPDDPMPGHPAEPDRPVVSAGTTNDR